MCLQSAIDFVVIGPLGRFRLSRFVLHFSPLFCIVEASRGNAIPMFKVANLMMPQRV